jgi:hypothetical protein
MSIPAQFQGWDSKRFAAALAAGELDLAEAWLRFVQDNRELYPKYKGKDFVVSDREHELIIALRDKAQATGDSVWYSRAKAMIERSTNPDHLANRRKRLVEISGIPYEDIP